MKKSRLSPLALAFLAAALPAWQAAAIPFASFAGDYDKHGAMSVSDGSGAKGSGTATLRFRVASDGESARLRISGVIEQGDDLTRPFAVNYLFKVHETPKHKKKHIALISNLAPGIDDGLDSRGTYMASGRRISAIFPVEFGNVTGLATVEIRLTKREHSARLEATQTLTTSAISRPIVWKFSGAASR